MTGAYAWYSAASAVRSTASVSPPGLTRLMARPPASSRSVWQWLAATDGSVTANADARTKDIPIREQPTHREWETVHTTPGVHVSLLRWRPPFLHGENGRFCRHHARIGLVSMR